jgi:DGQHR domain-containing protein
MEDKTAPSTMISKIARVIDGQHRIAGLAAFKGESFDLSVTIFIEADISDQAQIFATVNLEQTKVNKSLVYDLFELAHSRSPQKTCHNIAVALDRDLKSPFYRRIRRLGMATEGRYFEPITQATFVEMLVAYISADPKADRDAILRGRNLSRLNADELVKFPFRNLFLDQKDIEIGTIVTNFFGAVRHKWPEAWDFKGRGGILDRTNGFRALMRFLRYAYLFVSAPGEVPSSDKFFQSCFQQIEAVDADFTLDNFPPGSAGEARLLRVLRRQETLL